MIDTLKSIAAITGKPVSIEVESEPCFYTQLHIGTDELLGTMYLGSSAEDAEDSLAIIRQFVEAAGLAEMIGATTSRISELEAELDKARAEATEALRVKALRRSLDSIGLREAKAIVDHLEAKGIVDCYAGPYGKIGIVKEVRQALGSVCEDEKPMGM